jgi:hypothetical protein
MKFKFAFVLLILLSGCAQIGIGNPQGNVPEQPEVSVPTLTPIPTATPTDEPTATLIPSPTPEPTNTPTATPDLDYFALSNVASQTRGGTQVEIAYLLIGDKQLFEDEIAEFIENDPDLFADTPVLAYAVFNITNNSGKGIHLHPRNGRVVINEEQIKLADYDSYTSVDDRFDGAYYAGERVVGGGVWFGIKESEIDEIDQMVLVFHGPYYVDEKVYAKDYYFLLDLSEHVIEEIPDFE